MGKNRKQSRKYPSYQDAIEDLSKKGTIDYAGRNGGKMEWGIFGYELYDGRKYILKIGMDDIPELNGRVEILYRLN